MFLYRDRRGAQFVGVAAVGNRDDDVARVDLSEAAVQGFGGVQKRRHRPDRAKNTRSIARDVFGLTNSRHMDAATTRLRRSNHRHRARNCAKIDRAPQRDQFSQRCIEEIARPPRPDRGRWIRRLVAIRGAVAHSGNASP